MTISYTALLGLAQPVTGTETGQWGTVVNDEITALLEDAVANAASISVTAGNVTLSTTNGSSNQARMSTLIITGTPGTTRNVVAPSQAKIYVVINQSDGAVVIKGAATSGVTIGAGQTAQVAWNGSDFVEIGNYVHGNFVVNGNLSVNGDSTLGNAGADTTTINGQVIAANSNISKTTTLSASAPALAWIKGATYTDTGTAGGTTQALAPFTVFSTPTLSTSNIVTYTDAATVYIAGAPAAAGSATITNPYSLYVAAGNAYFGASVSATTLDLTNLEVTNIKAKDGTASMTLADSTGVVTFSKATVIETTDNTNAALRITQLGTGNALLVEDSANPDSSPFVVTATGDVGIGTNSPAQLLHVAKSQNTDTAIFVSNSNAGTAAETSIYASNDGTAAGGFFASASGTGFTTTGGFFQDGVAIGSGSSSSGGLSIMSRGSGTPIRFYAGGFTTENMRLDSSGNLGLGVTPSAWASTWRALQIGIGTSLAGITNDVDVNLTNNAIWNGTNWVRLATSPAERYRQNNGQHQWFNAPSGTANSASVTSGASYTVVALGSSTLAQWQAFFNDSSNNPLTVTPTLGQVLTGNATGTLLGGGLVTQNISFTQAMTLDASGNLQLATTTSSNRTITVGGTGASIALAGSNGGIYFGAAGTPAGSGGFGENAAIARAGNTNFHITGSVAGDLCIAAEGTKSILFGTSSSSGSTSERARITSGGALLVGKTTTTLNNTTGTDISGGFIATHSSSGNGTIELGATRSAVAANIGGIVSFRAVYRNSDADSTNIANIKGYRENATDNNWSSYLAFETTNGSTLAERARISSDGTFRVKGAGTAGTTDAVQFSGSAPASAMTLDASGNLGVGATSPNFRLEVRGSTVTNGDAIRNMAVISTNSASAGLGGGIAFGGYYNGTTNDINDFAGIQGFKENGTAGDYAGALRFTTRVNGGTPTERARITSGGYFKASNNGTYADSTGGYHEFYQTNNTDTVRVTSTSTAVSGAYGVYVDLTTDPNATDSFFLRCYGGANQRASIRSNGGLANYQANDVNLSDQRVKKDIVAAPSYWDKIKGIEIVHFKYKDQTHDDNNVGVIAQQVEQVAPEFVDQNGWGDTPEDGVPLKSIYTSDMYHAAIKALQEAMARIEKLEAEVAALKGA